MPKETFTKEELAFLSEEERAGVLDDSPDAAEEDHHRQQARADKGPGRADPPPNEADAERAAAGDDAKDADDGKDADDSKAAADDKAKPKDKAAKDTKTDDGAAKEGASEGGDAEGADGAQDAPERPDIVPALKGSDVDFKAARAELRTQRTALRTKFNAGDLTQEEFDAGIDELDEKAQTLTRHEARAEMAAEFNDTMRSHTWSEAQASFFTSHPEYQERRGLRAGLDAYVEQIDRETKGTLSGAVLLLRAHQAVQKELGVEPTRTAAPAKEGAAQRPGPKSEGKAIADANAKAPRGLADLPNADNADDAGHDRFAHLDSLAGLEFEQAFRKLSEADQNAYLANV